MNIVHEWSPILMRINAVKFHPAVPSFAACDITSVIHSELVFFLIFNNEMFFFFDLDIVHGVPS